MSHLCLEWIIMLLTQDENTLLEALSADEQSYRQLRQFMERKLALQNYLLDYSDNLMICLNPSRDILYINKPLAHLLNVSEQNIIGKTLQYLQSEQSLTSKTFSIAFEETIRTGQSSKTELDLQIDGKDYYFSTQLFPELDEQGVVQTVVILGIDITDLKRREHDLKIADAQLQRSQEISGVGSWEVNLTTNKVSWSDGFRRICNIADNIQPTYDFTLSLVHPDDLASFNAILQQAQQNNVPYKIENCMITPNDEIRWVDSRGEFIVDEVTGDTKLIGAILDITERKETEQALKESEQLYRSVLSVMTEGITLYDVSGKIIMFNRAAETITGYKREQLVGRLQDTPKGVFYTLDREHYPVEEFPSLKTLKTQEPQSDVLMGFRNGITREIRWIRVHTRPLYDPDTGDFFAVLTNFSDITESRRANELALQAAIDGERSRLLTNFITLASHEFRTPLTVIATNAYLMNRLDDQQKRQQKFERISEKIEQLNQLIDMQLRMTKLDSGVELNLVETSIKVFVDDILFNLRDKINTRAITLRNHVGDYTCPLDADYFYHAFFQVLDNAIRYTSLEGVIDIETEVTDDNLAIMIKDDGLGIEVDDLDDVFEPFWRKDTAQTQAGLGLGLTLAQKIIDLHAGKIAVKSTPDEGSQFTITLPL